MIRTRRCSRRWIWRSSSIPRWPICIRAWRCRGARWRWISSAHTMWRSWPASCICSRLRIAKACSAAAGSAGAAILGTAFRRTSGAIVGSGTNVGDGTCGVALGTSVATARAIWSVGALCGLACVRPRESVAQPPSVAASEAAVSRVFTPCAPGRDGLLARDFVMVWRPFVVVVGCRAGKAVRNAPICARGVRHCRKAARYGWAAVH